MSGVGKGVSTASLGTILQAKGFRISLMKADPYLNVDAGTMNPTEHGEVFVMDSGLETDQDMGNYERFLNKNLPAENYMTNGMVFKYVIDKERALGYKGKCVEPTYHITEEILRRIELAVRINDADITIIEVGGTAGEYQNAIFLEAARQLKIKHPKDVIFVMVSYLPVPGKLGEMKTKPTQNAVRQMNSYGVHPDFIIARSENSVDKKRKEKIANMCGVLMEHVISAPDVNSIYDVPLNFEKDGLSKEILNFFELKSKQNHLKPWRDMVLKAHSAKGELKIAIVGKYFTTGDYMLSDAYISVIEALKASSIDLGIKLSLDWKDSVVYERDRKQLKELSDYDGILIPGGFGSTGIEGMISTITYAREKKIPYFGLCYGMQLMVIEYARNVLGLSRATSHEIDPSSSTQIITLMHDQKMKLKQKDYGASMRLGAYPCSVAKETLAYRAYKQEKILERHRHRYEVNPEFVGDLEKAGLVFSGKSPDGILMEIAELSQKVHPFFLGTQFHPEFLARPLSPHPLFSEFLRSALKK